MNDLMDEIENFKVFNKLKEVYRRNSVGLRRESSSEHSWSSLLLADFILSKAELKIDKMRVYELLMYHDVLEIELGDTPLIPGVEKVLDENEESALNNLQVKLPKTIRGKFLSLFKEFNEQKTREAKFAKLIDSLDPVIHELDYKRDWEGWSKDLFIRSKKKYFKDFEELSPIFNEILNYLVNNGYFKNKQYFVKNGENKELPISEIGAFEVLFEGFTKPFMDENKCGSCKKEILERRDNNKAVYLVKNSYQELYGGALWNDSDVEMISNMDYMYCLPSWDWWINPQYPAKLYRNEYLHHIPGKYGYTVIFVNNNKDREEDYKRILTEEKFEIVDIKRQYEENCIDLFMFYDYWMVFLPLKLARGLNRIKINVEKAVPHSIYFLLRSGFLIAEFFEYQNVKKEIINPQNFSGNLDNPYVIDDCIVMARNLKKIGLKRESVFTLSVLDCAIPKRIYKKEFLNAEIDAPEDMINMFSCRFFEKNPFLIGLDIKDGKYIYYNNLIRKKFIERIKSLQSLSNINELVTKMADDLFNYENGGYKNEQFTEFVGVKSK